MELDKRFFLGLLTVMFVIALGYSAADNYLVHYQTVSEVLADPPENSVRVSGKMTGELSAEVDTYTFNMTDGSSTMKVVYKGTLPLAFNTESDVVVIGKLGEDNTFRAVTLITKCPSKFEA